jgi:hypothetical protein
MSTTCVTWSEQCASSLRESLVVRHKQVMKRLEAEKDSYVAQVRQTSIAVLLVFWYIFHEKNCEQCTA